MHAGGHGGLPVVGDGGQMVGMLDRLTLLRLILPRYAEDIGDLAFLPEDFKPFEARLASIGRVLVRDVVQPCDCVAAENTPVVEVAALMLTKNTFHVPVLRAGKIVGIIGLQDIVDEIVWPHFKRDEAGA
jgi:CBS domain-containing protein